MAGGEAGFHEDAEEAHTWRSGLNSGKLDRQAQPHQPPTQLPACPECGSQRIWKDGVRCTNRGEVQRYICRACGYRFSETTWNNSDEPEDVERVHTTALYSVQALPYNRQVGVTETQGAKNLAEVEPHQERAGAGATLKPSEADVKGKIVELAWWMKKQGFREPTIESYCKTIKQLANKTSIFNPESVKETIAKQSWKESTKRRVVIAYACFLQMLGLTWDPPIYRIRESLPFIPAEEEIDSLIASCGKKMATFLQGLKETGADPGELIALRWIDVDSRNRTVTINHPVKGHDPRILSISGKLLDMLQRRPKNSERVFGDITIPAMHSNFYPQRKRTSVKLANPRLKKITFITLRHWKGTMEYHKTKDILHVKKILGHKSINSTMVYINLEQAHFKAASEEFTVRVAETIEEDKELIEVGFEYVTDRGNLKVYRKRK